MINDDEVYVRQIPSGLSIKDMLVLEDGSLPMLTRAGSKDEVVVTVKLQDPSRSIEVVYKKVAVKDAQMQLQARKGEYLASAARLREEIAQQMGKSGESQEAQQVQKRSVSDMHLLNQKNEALNEEGLPFYEPVEQISEEEATKQGRNYMQPFVRSEDENAADKDKRKRWLDDTLSKLEAEELDEGSDEEMPALNAGSNAEAPQDSAPPVEENRVVLRTRTPSPSPPPSPEDALKPKNLPEIVSAARPPPVKSALKAVARPDIVQRPSFGSSGIRHGFLNLNPSSPGAIKSSYSWEDLEKDQPKESDRPSRSVTPTPLSRNGSTVGSSLLSRVVDAGSSPITSGASTPSRKSVRIKSPERPHPEAAPGSGLTPLQRALRSSIRVKENYEEPSNSLAQRSLDSGSGTAEKRHKDDIGVEEEAERIVKLLGPDVVEGHPNAPPPDVLRKMQEAHEEDRRLSTPEAVAARAKQEEKERERERLQRLAEKPALGQAVMERPSGGGSREKGKENAEKAKAQQAKFSAFKAGFLNQKPAANASEKERTRFVPNASVGRKAGPKQSLGMSAIDRASLGDDELSERRQAMGLSAAVPHARPSKAYAEKMKQRQEGKIADVKEGAEDEEKDVTLARPKEGDDMPRPGRVRFGPHTGSTNDEDEAEEVNEINPGTALENHLPEDVDDGRELDEEQEEPKIEGEGADTDEDEDAYFDSYLSNRSRRSAAAESRGLDDGEGEEFDEDDWDMDEEDEDDFEEDDEDDFDYDPDDLMALAPRMGADAEGLSGNPELLREYEEARARLAAMGLKLPGDASSGSGNVEETRAAMEAAAREQEDDDYEMDVVPLDAAVEDAEYQGNTTSTLPGSSRISRFKASLAQQRTTPSGKNLEEMLSGARNLGSDSAAFGMDGKDQSAPMMIIPQLAPVRFPKNGDLIEGKSSGPVELDGWESDDDDERAEMVMRSRLEREEWKRDNPEKVRGLREKRRQEEAVQMGKAAPVIGSRKVEKTVEEVKGGTGAQEEEVAVEPKKKVSRFKAARMGQ